MALIVAGVTVAIGEPVNRASSDRRRPQPVLLHAATELTMSYL
jgi:hypothetical protein